MFLFGARQAPSWAEISRATSRGVWLMPLIGIKSIGQAESATMQGRSARSVPWSPGRLTGGAMAMSRLSQPPSARWGRSTAWSKEWAYLSLNDLARLCVVARAGQA